LPCTVVDFSSFSLINRPFVRSRTDDFCYKGDLFHVSTMISKSKAPTQIREIIVTCIYVLQVLVVTPGITSYNEKCCIEVVLADTLCHFHRASERNLTTIGRMYIKYEDGGGDCGAVMGPSCVG